MNINSRERRLHQVEVGTLSRQGMSLYATHYRQPFAFSTIPYPLIQQIALRLSCQHACALWRTVGLTTFPDLPTRTIRIVACLSVKDSSFLGLLGWRRNSHHRRELPAVHLLVPAYQQIEPVNFYPGSNDDSLYVAHSELALPLDRLSAGSF